MLLSVDILNIHWRIARSSDIDAVKVKLFQVEIEICFGNQKVVISWSHMSVVDLLEYFENTANLVDRMATSLVTWSHSMNARSPFDNPLCFITFSSRLAIDLESSISCLGNVISKNLISLVSKQRNQMNRRVDDIITQSIPSTNNFRSSSISSFALSDSFA